MKFSVIIPSYNQGSFIQRTIKSVLDQSGDFDIDFVVIDGGSTDNTVTILSKYQDIVDSDTFQTRSNCTKYSWVSEKDDGQADAVNKGFARTSGEIIAWINSDDIYYPGAFESAQRIFEENPDVDVIYGLSNFIDEHDNVTEPFPTEPWNYGRLFDECYICQPGTFFRRRLINQFGPLDAKLIFCLDYELWLRYGKSARFVYLEKLLAGSRMYSSNKTLGQRVAVHTEINEMFLEKFGAVPRKWIYGYAEVVAEDKMKELGLERIDLDLEREIAQEAFLKWHGSIPLKELNYMDKFLSNPGTIMWPVRRRLSGLDKLRIGFDISQTFPGSAGCGYAPKMIIETLIDGYPEDEFILYKRFGTTFCDSSQADLIPTIQTSNIHYALTDLNDAEAYIFWSRMPEHALASLGCPDVIHSNNFFCPPIPGTKIVYTLYDLSFLDHPEFTTPENIAACKKGVDEASRYADMIIAISDYSRNRFLHYYPEYPESRITTVHLASRFNQNSETKPVDGLNANSFWLSVCTLEPRKNLRGLLKAYRVYVGTRKDVPPLVLTGGKGWLEDELPQFIETIGLAKHVKILGYMVDSQLQWLYENCLAFCYPSFYEGFGLPVLEAMSLGAPVIVSNTTSLPEVAGDAGLYIDPNDVEQISEAFRKMELNDELRKTLKKKGLLQAAKFSWEHTVEKIHGIYEELVDFAKRQPSGANDFYSIARLEKNRTLTGQLEIRTIDWFRRHPGFKEFVKSFRVVHDVVTRRKS